MSRKFSRHLMRWALLNFHVIFPPSNSSHHALAERSAVGSAEVSLSCVTHVTHAESMKSEWSKKAEGFTAVLHIAQMMQHKCDVPCRQSTSLLCSR